MARLFAFLAAFVAATLASSGAKAKELPIAKTGYRDVEAMVLKLARVMALNEPQTRWLVRWFLVQSFSESKGKLSAANESESESAAAAKGYDSRGNAEKLRKAVGSFARSLWIFPGSAGWFGLMPYTLLNVVGGRSARGLGLGPRSNVDPWASVVMYAAYVDALLDRPEWKRSAQNAYALKAGGAAGSLMDDPHKARYQVSVGHVNKAVAKFGFPQSFKTERLPPGIFNVGRDYLAIYKAGRE